MLLIAALLMSFTIPNISGLSARALRQQAEKLVASVDLARQRSVMTGVPHRILIDLDEGLYRIEWLAVDPEDAEPDSGATEETYTDAPLSLAPPPAANRQYTPLAGMMGRLDRLEKDIVVSGVETPGGWVETGQAYLSFERDGTSSYTTIVLDDPDGNHLYLEILPLADTVRISDEPR